MTLSIKSELFIKIYSIDYLLKCRIDEATEGMLKLSPVSGKVDMFQVYDPVVAITFEGKQIQIFPADVANINNKSGQVVFNRPVMEIEDERRIFERYPVSLVVSARRKFSNKRLHFIIKNLSMFGMGAISKADLDEEELLDIDLITEKSMFYFSGKIIWKKVLGNCYEYGIQITHFDVATKQAYEVYLESHKSEYFKMILKAR